MRSRSYPRIGGGKRQIQDLGVGSARSGHDVAVATTGQLVAKALETESCVGGEHLKVVPLPTTSVIICAYTEARWALMLRAVASIQAQTSQPCEIILCIDHNEALFRRCAERWADFALSNPPIRVIQNKYDGHLGAARNTAAEMAVGEILAFLDDDAWADKDWLNILSRLYQDERIGAVGGRPLPAFETARPGWFPEQFYWVFGCAYDGLPTKRAPLARLIGANMSVRRAVLEQVGGFHSDNHDDMDMCHRVAHMKGSDAVLYEPAAIVHHHVPAARLTRKYFWRRCFFVNKGKVEAFARMGDAAALGSEARFAWYALTRGVPRGMLQAVAGDYSGLARASAIVAGLALAASGHVAGRLERVWPFRQLDHRAMRQLPNTGARPAGRAE